MKIQLLPPSGSFGIVSAQRLAQMMAGIVCGLALSASAQTNEAAGPRTNIVAAAPNFREVDGQLYNIGLSKLWRMQSGKILEVQTNSVLLQTYATNDVFENVLVPGPGQPGYTFGQGGHFEQRLVSSHREPAKQIFINHYRIGSAEQEISVPAMQTGTSRINGAFYEIWDCGLPHSVTNDVPAGVAGK